MADVLAGMGRMLLGANQASHETSKSTPYRSWEGALFQVGMICLAVGYTTCFCEPRPHWSHSPPWSGRTAEGPPRSSPHVPGIRSHPRPLAAVAGACWSETTNALWLLEFEHRHFHSFLPLPLSPGLSVKHNLYRYVMMAPGRLLMVVGHVLVCIWVSALHSL